MPAPAFCIVQSVPRYCQITDGLVGSTNRIVRYCETEAFAHKMAGVMERRDHEEYGDSHYEVRFVNDPYGRTRISPNPIVQNVLDDLPF